jgi:hypothetical protein
MAPRSTSPHIRDNTRSTPQSQYTNEVRAGGLGALREARARHRYGTRQLEAGQGYSRTPSTESDLYDRWLSGMRPTPNYPTMYGRSEEGAYAGFKNEGTLKAAIEGNADIRRDMDRDLFSALDDMASTNLDQLETDYGARRGEAFARDDWGNRPQPMAPTTYARPPADPNAPDLADDDKARTTAANRRSEFVYGGDNDANPFNDADPALIRARGDEYDAMLAANAPNEPVAEPKSVPKIGSRAASLSPQMVDRYYGNFARDAFVNDELDPWLATQSGKYLDQQDFAQQGLNTPVSEYTAMAGAEYGVDPNIVAGWYDDAGDVTDYRTQRDLEMIEDTGMLNTDFEQAAGKAEREQAALDALGDKEYDADVDDELNSQVFDATGGMLDADHLSTVLKVSPEDAHGIVTSDAYQMYAAEITDAMNLAQETGDPADLEETMTTILDTTRFANPRVYTALMAVYGDVPGGVTSDYVPTDYDVFGS